MNWNEAADLETATIRVQWDLVDPPEKVWRALTDPELLSEWLMPTDMRAESGYRFTFRSQPRPGWDGIVHCEILEVIPCERLVYSWRGSSRNEAGQELDTTVMWTILPTSEGGTRLVLEHSGFEPEGFAFKAMSQGWQGKIAYRITEVIAKM